MRTLGFLIATVLLFAGCRNGAVSTVNVRDALIGHWVGEVHELPEVDFTRWHVHRKADGTYTIVFRNHLPDGSFYDYKTAGTWRVDGDYYCTSTLSEQTDKAPEWSPTHYEDRYRILSLSRDNFSYQDLKSGIVFSVRRVESSYALPPR